MLRSREYPSERLRRSEDEHAPQKPAFYERPDSYGRESWRRPTPKFEVRAAASKWRKRISTALATNPVVQHVAERLSDCGKGRQCHSGACPSCLRLLRRWLILEGERLVGSANGQAQTEIAFLTLILPFTRVPEGRLSKVDVSLLKDRIAHILDRLGLGDCWLFGGVDFSLNGPDPADSKWYWQPHLHAMVLCPRGLRSFRTKIKKLPNGDPSIPKVAVVEAVKDLRHVIGYCMKAVFQRRIPYIDEFGRTKFRKLIIKPRDMAELACFLDSAPIPDRLFLKNVRRRGSRLIVTLPQPVKPPTQEVELSA